jgi:hypothetical protein
MNTLVRLAQGGLAKQFQLKPLAGVGGLQDHFLHISHEVWVVSLPTQVFEDRAKLRENDKHFLGESQLEKSVFSQGSVQDEDATMPQ